MAKKKKSVDQSIFFSLLDPPRAARAGGRRQGDHAQGKGEAFPQEERDQLIGQKKQEKPQGELYSCQQRPWSLSTSKEAEGMAWGSSSRREASRTRRRGEG